MMNSTLVVTVKYVIRFCFHEFITLPLFQKKMVYMNSYI